MDDLNSSCEEDGTFDEFPSLTILTVVVEKNHDDVRNHLKLMDRLNPGVSWHLIVVDNSSTGSSKLTVDDRRVEIRSGVAFDHSKPNDVRASYHHAAALNANLNGIRSRFLLVIDPDLFVVYPDWIREVSRHMLQRKLGFFGVPWHPRWFSKYRGFPCVHFMLIDLQSVPLDRLDFRPELLEKPSWTRLRMAANGTQTETDRPPSRGPALSAGWTLLGVFYRALYPLLSRQLIGSSRDTGSRVWAAFGRSGRHRVDTVLPVVDIDRDFPEPAFLTASWGRLLDRVMPARFRFLPSHGAYIAPADANGFDIAEFEDIAAEKFMWRGRPFAFHMRRHMKVDASATDRARERAAVSRALDRF